MRVIRSFAEAAEGRGSVVTIGNYDGVHLGHQTILRQVVERARELNLDAAVLTFDPHPARVLAPERAPKLLQTTSQKLRRFGTLGIDTALLLEFSKDFALLSPEEFARRVLLHALQARVVMVGEDFRFGHKQTGDIATLRELGSQLGFAVEVVAEVACSGSRVSSTRIRDLVREGKVSRACRLMGQPFALEGPVVSGHGIGSKQTVPTLNLAAENELLPRNGVYVTRTRLDEATAPVPSITNVGYRPTFAGTELTVETFLLGNPPAAAPERIEVQFLSFIRDERRFENPEALKAGILRDVGIARRFHRIYTAVG